MKPASGVSWFVESGGVTLWSRGGARLSIPYPFAGLWALVADGNYDKGFAAELMSVLMASGRQEAERQVERTLAGWVRAGLLTEE